MAIVTRQCNESEACEATNAQTDNRCDEFSTPTASDNEQEAAGIEDEDGDIFGIDALDSVSGDDMIFEQDTVGGNSDTRGAFRCTERGVPENTPFKSSYFMAIPETKPQEHVFLKAHVSARSKNNESIFETSDGEDFETHGPELVDSSSDEEPEEDAEVENFYSEDDDDDDDAFTMDKVITACKRNAETNTTETASLASYVGLPHVTDDDRPGIVNHEHATGSPKSKRHTNRQSRKVKARNDKIDRCIVLHLVGSVFYMCISAVIVATAAKIAEDSRFKKLEDEWDLLTFDQPGIKKRKTWATRVKEAKQTIMKMFAIQRGFTVDSGAADHVIPRGWIAFIHILESIGSRMGVTYIAANGSRINSEGEQRVPFMTREGSWMEIVFQVARVNKPLLSVSKLIDSDMRVVFDKSGSYIYNKLTGDIVRVKRERGVFVLEAFVERDPNKPTNLDSGFKRQD